MLGVFWFWSLTGGDTGNVTTGWVSSSLSTSGAYHSSGGEGTREAAAKDFAGPVTKHKAQRQLIWSFYTWNTWRAYTWNEGFKKELVRVPLTVSWICYQINLSNKNCLVYPCLDGTPQQCVPAPKSSSITLYLQQEKLELCLSCTSILTQKSLILAGICCIPIPERDINLQQLASNKNVTLPQERGKEREKGKERERTWNRATAPWAVTVTPSAQLQQELHIPLPPRHSGTSLPASSLTAFVNSHIRHKE